MAGVFPKRATRFKLGARFSCESGGCEGGIDVEMFDRGQKVMPDKFYMSRIWSVFKGYFFRGYFTR
jgi:hypothetical protein